MEKTQYILEAHDPKCGYAVYWTGKSYSRKRESSFRFDSLSFAELSAKMCNKDMCYLTFIVITA